MVRKFFIKCKTFLLLYQNPSRVAFIFCRSAVLKIDIAKRCLSGCSIFSAISYKRNIKKIRAVCLYLNIGRSKQSTEATPSIDCFQSYWSYCFDSGIFPSQWIQIICSTKSKSQKPVKQNLKKIVKCVLWFGFCI